MNHTGRAPKRFKSSCSKFISELLPLPQRPVIASVSGGSVLTLRKNRDKPLAVVEEEISQETVSLHLVDANTGAELAKIGRLEVAISI